MALALHLGMPVELMLRSMTEAEFSRWMVYASRRQLPLDRIELLLAQIPMVLSRLLSRNSKAKVADFMLHQPDIDFPDNVTPIEAAKRAFGFSPRKKQWQPAA